MKICIRKSTATYLAIAILSLGSITCASVLNLTKKTSLTDPSAKFSELVGTVQTLRQELGELSNARIDNEIKENDQIITHANSRARVEVSDGTVIEIGQLSSVVLQHIEARGEGISAKLSFEEGDLWISLNSGWLEVETPVGTTSIQGSGILVRVIKELSGDIIICQNDTCSVVGNTFDGNVALAERSIHLSDVGELSDVTLNSSGENNPGDSSSNVEFAANWLAPGAVSSSMTLNGNGNDENKTNNGIGNSPQQPGVDKPKNTRNPNITNSPVDNTNTPTPTNTQFPTNTPVYTNTAVATDTQAPTATQLPTSTQLPSNSPEPTDPPPQEATSTPEAPTPTPTATNQPEQPSPSPPDEDSAGSNCDFTIDSNVMMADGQYNFKDVGPGDVVCIPGGQRPTLELKNFRGEPGNPITFINYEGTVTIDDPSGHASIHFINSEYVVLTGTGVSIRCGATYSPSNQECGFRLLNGARGVTGNQGTRYIQIDHVEVSRAAGTGINVKSSLPRGEFIQYDTIIQDTYIHDVGTEGMYIGSSKYLSSDDPVLEGVWISQNLVERTGWDGIQVGSAVKNCFIYSNKIMNASTANKSSQRSGIQNNPGSVCNIYNNFIFDSGSKGIYIQGNGSNKVYNNLIVRPGTLDRDGGGHGIVVTDANDTGNSIFVWNNTIIDPYNKGIKYNNHDGSNNQILNNIVVNPGEEYIDDHGLSNVTVDNNLLTNDIQSVGFSNPFIDDYSLQGSSPAVDSGVDLSDEGLLTDIRDYPRYQGLAYDIGAYEYYR